MALSRLAYLNIFILCLVLLLATKLILDGADGATAFTFENDPAIKKIESRVESDTKNKDELKPDQQVITSIKFDADKKLVLSQEIIPKHIAGVSPDTKPKARESASVAAMQPRVYSQQHEPDQKFPRLGQRFLVGADNANGIKWTYGLFIDHGPVGENPDTRIEYQNVMGSSADGLIIKSPRGHWVRVIDPETGKLIVERQIKTQVIDKIFSTFHVYNKDTNCFYVTTGLNNDAVKQVQLVEWNLDTEKETVLATLPNQSFTKVKPHVNAMVIDKDHNCLLMAVQTPSRIKEPSLFLIYSLNKGKFVYKDDMYMFANPDIIVGPGGLVGVRYYNKNTEHVLATYDLSALQ